ncbi:tRNA pseudouridine(38-40) synthase TruA [Metabacillus litoralis]|uniref:tRNA pseudouridine(38-40) synthase TruA n=1 Tax=Metabacillus litoralis TaxID=152268 RepID=UPI00203ED96B|nr:tRNA pseudouridine(38-40) synthase TruA [Metabacillus litoralis]MCM3413331.1 tRNA pseudouridine(38-40) synthase TruA [Metabacillus litoralis]
MRVKCIVSYDGTQFSGYQVQPNKRTVQSEIENSLLKLHKGQAVKIFASGRTDAQVHALGQVFHFDTHITIPEKKWPYALNSLLPDDISIKEAVYVDDDFHSRFHALKKEYRYQINTAKIQDVFKRHYMYHFPYPLDVELMRKASQYLCGTHDFTSFCVAKTEVEDKVRTIFSIDIIKEESDIIFSFVGNGFLYNMVRILVGTLLEVGQGMRSPESISAVINGRDRSLSGKTVPGHGLYLWKVYYDN